MTRHSIVCCRFCILIRTSFAASASAQSEIDDEAQSVTAGCHEKADDPVADFRRRHLSGDTQRPSLPEQRYLHSARHQPRPNRPCRLPIFRWPSWENSRRFPGNCSGRHALRMALRRKKQHLVAGPGWLSPPPGHRPPSGARWSQLQIDVAASPWNAFRARQLAHAFRRRSHARAVLAR